MRILIADDHGLIRHGVRWLLEDEPDFEVVGEAADGIEAIQKTVELKPDILLSDMRMPGADGAEVSRQVKEVSPQTKVIIFSLYSNRNYVKRALSAGASGYILKNLSNVDIVEAIRKINSGQTYLNPGLENIDQTD